MFHLTLSPKINKVFEGFCVLRRNDEIKCLYSFPTNYSFQRYYEFIFPCNCPKEKTEEYCVVISNANNDRSFLLCRYSDVYQLYLCIYSLNPWFEIFSKLLFNLCHNDFMPDEFNRIGLYLREISEMCDESHILLPPCSANDNIKQVILKNSQTYPYIYDKYIKEYLTANKPTSSSRYNKELWLEVFWSMLLERPIIFMSKRYQKLTSSLLAATFFIHPLSWLHKFVSIIPQKNPQLLGMNCCMLGIHSCMEPILATTDFWNEALLVDLDKGESKMVGASENEKETQSRFKIPKIIKNFFISHIQAVDENVSSNNPIKIKDLIPNTPWNFNEEEKMYNDYKKGFHIYSLLFRTIISMLIGNYRQFIYLGDDGSSNSKVNLYEFEKEKFIQSNSKLSEFLRIFVQSQCFDSFIEDKLKYIQSGKVTDDRFDRERQELASKPKNSYPKPKESKSKQRKRKEKPGKAAYHSKTVSMSSSASSINSNNNYSQDIDNMSNKSESLEDQIVRGLAERRLIVERNPACNLPTILSYMSDKEIQPIYEPNSKINSKPANNCNNQVSHKKPLRPMFRPGEAPVGLVTRIVQQINHGNVDGNSANRNVKKSVSQIKASELPATNKPVAQLASMFEPKSVA